MNWHQNKSDYTHTRGVWNAVKKTTTNKTPNTLLSSQTTLFAYIWPVSGQPCQLNTDPAGESSPGFNHLWEGDCACGR
jgi:hypothetical protein